MHNFPSDLFMSSFQGREALHRFSYSLKYDYVLDGKGIVALPWVL